jgi:hypothetical protein
MALLRIKALRDCCGMSIPVGGCKQLSNVLGVDDTNFPSTHALHADASAVVGRYVGSHGNAARLAA